MPVGRWILQGRFDPEVVAIRKEGQGKEATSLCALVRVAPAATAFLFEEEDTYED